MEKQQEIHYEGKTTLKVVPHFSGEKKKSEPSHTGLKLQKQRLK